MDPPLRGAVVKAVCVDPAATERPTPLGQGFLKGKASVKLGQILGPRRQREIGDVTGWGAFLLIFLMEGALPIDLSGNELLG